LKGGERRRGGEERRGEQRGGEVKERKGRGREKGGERRGECKPVLSQRLESCVYVYKLRTVLCKPDSMWESLGVLLNTSNSPRLITFSPWRESNLPLESCTQGVLRPSQEKAR
jgi:hypothetical protein